jgi:ATP-dependent DNA helicase RecG
MLKTVYFDAHHRPKGQCFRIRLVDKKKFYDRQYDSDVVLLDPTAIALINITKQKIYTEQRVYPFVKPEHLHMEYVQHLRNLAKNNLKGDRNHPWDNISDDLALLKSLQLYTFDYTTGVQGFNLAAIMLLGKRDVIANVVPAYVTDAIFTKFDIDRYDDRDVVNVNLIDSYERLMQFGLKHTNDKFCLENNIRISLNKILLREMIANTLIHREFTSPLRARFIIESDKMFVENACCARAHVFITPENNTPIAKNPIIAEIFRNIGYAEHLGSGVRNLFKYSKAYSGKDPIFEESDIFRITVPIDYSFVNHFVEEDNKQQAVIDKNRELSLINLLKENPSINQDESAKQLGVSLRVVKRIFQRLQDKGIIYREGSRKKGLWKFKED